MKKAWYIYKRYFLPPQILLFVILGIALVKLDKSETQYPLIFIILSLFIMLSFLSAMRYYNYEVLRPKKIIEELNSELFNEFKRNGFKLKGRDWVGQIRDYTVLAGIEWENHQETPDYRFRVLFDPLSLGRNLSLEEYVNYNDLEKNNFYVNLSHLEKSHNLKAYSSLNYNRPLIVINSMVDYLIIKNLIPITPKEWGKHVFNIERMEKKYLSKI
ncbi:hypothetical protein [Olleya sp. 1-3]|uniref:hypothetical protein n=1 Tax=Olleya sp. 1-3 TaxID=2058323 RepID=UPI000C33C338|nr:hypothetical protein [Olleya sp. 1-3]PKG52849.1 hypothetical protein CXF54_03480 [Olleya sp. 1-3]